MPAAVTEGDAGRRCCDRLIVDGVIAGVGSVIVFLPQILILFFFILLLEATGYMVRAALPDGPADGAAWACRAAPSSRSSPPLPAPCPASWQRARSTTPRTG